VLRLWSTPDKCIQTNVRHLEMIEMFYNYIRSHGGLIISIEFLFLIFSFQAKEYEETHTPLNHVPSSWGHISVDSYFYAFDCYNATAVLRGN
jgi:hypothetical protein